jgi:phosphoribosylformylglycinamidine (FGAM) synthase-like enzyme
VYDRPTSRPEYLDRVRTLNPGVCSTGPSPQQALLSLLASPTIASKRWVYRQYDHMVRTNTLVLAGMGAGVVRVQGTSRALAISVDGNGRYCYLNPRRGAMLALAEAARNVACAGAVPIGATNCLNFGNPERPEIMWQFVESVEGLADACRALDIPITGGNVSLYNETDGQAIYPTPIIGVVGVIDDATRVVARAFKAPGSDIILLGESYAELGGSEYLRIIHGLVAGDPPWLDLNAERGLLGVLARAAGSGLLQSAHDGSDGGLAVSLAECAFDTGGIGLDVDLPTALAGREAVAGRETVNPVIATLFGESASRVVVTVSAEERATLMQMAAAAGVPARAIGTTGGSRLRIRVDGESAVDCTVSEAEQIWATALERYFVGRAA